ncbi:MAG TPA: HipA family kinase [Candidatus Acidoferrales bacterium]|jgi:hypothetical protein|nr:HipA family kinase [Candidatus Acidoferrales bacterium]
MVGAPPPYISDSEFVCGLSNVPLISPPFVKAVEHIRPMRGGSQPHLMRCSDGHYYVVKFANNPQGLRILANEYLAGRLAKLLGLPCPEICVLEVKEELVRLTPVLSIQCPHGGYPAATGLAFGSQYPSRRYGANRTLLSVVELGPASRLGRVENLSDLTGILMFDKWTSNIDSRQILCLPRPTKHWRTYRLYMIDNGFCFGGCDWGFNDSPLRGLYLDMAIYSTFQNLQAFGPWLERLETRVTLGELNKIVEEIPRSWFKDDLGQFRELVNRLYERKKNVPALIQQTLTALTSWTSRYLARGC